MSVEERLGEAMRHVAGDTAAAPDALAHITTAAAGRVRARSRRLAMGAAAALAVLVATTALLAGRDQPSRVRTGPAGPGTTIGESAPTAVTEPPPATTEPGPFTTVAPAATVTGRPERLVVVDEEGRLMVVDATGGLVRVLAEPGLVANAAGRPPTPAVIDVEVSPDGRTVYFTLGHGQGGPSSVEIRSVPADGGQYQVVGRGRAPAVSPDGRFLAYAGDISQPVVDSRPGTASIVVRELATGRERRWQVDPADPDFFHVQGGISRIAWSPDGKQVAYQSDYEGSEVRVLALAGSTLSGTRVLEGIAVLGGWAADFGIVGLQECCYPEFQDPHRLVAIDVEAPDAVTLLRLPADVNAGSPDLSPDGTYILMREVRRSAVGVPYRLYTARLDHLSERTELGTAWVAGW